MRDGFPCGAAHVEKKRDRDIAIDLVLPPKNLFRWRDAGPQVGQCFDGGVQVVFHAIRQALLLAVQLGHQLLELAANLFEQPSAVEQGLLIEFKVTRQHDLFIHFAPVVTKPTFKNIPLVVNEGIRLARRQRPGILIGLCRRTSRHALHARIAFVELSQKILHHLAGLGILFLSLIIRIPPPRRPLTAQQIRKFLDSQRLPLFPRVCLRLRQQLSQFRPELAPIVDALG